MDFDTVPAIDNGSISCAAKDAQITEASTKVGRRVTMTPLGPDHVLGGCILGVRHPTGDIYASLGMGNTAEVISAHTIIAPQLVEGTCY